MNNLGRLFIALIVLAFAINECQAQDWKKKYSVIATQDHSRAAKTVWDMVEKDLSTLDTYEKFYIHSFSVFSKKQANKMLKKAKGNYLYNNNCGYAIREGYLYHANPNIFVVEGQDTIIFASRLTKAKWILDGRSRNKADTNWDTKLKN